MVIFHSYVSLPEGTRGYPKKTSAAPSPSGRRVAVEADASVAGSLASTWEHCDVKIWANINLEKKCKKMQGFL